MKTIRHGMILVLGLFIILAGVGFNAGDAGAAVLEKDANPVKMIFTSWGGVCMEREGQEKYFKVWKKDANTFEKLPIAKTNIQSFDVYDNLLVYLVNNNNMSYVNTYNLSTGQAAQLSVKFSNKRSVKTNGQYIVWEDFGLGKADLAIYNIAQGTTTLVESNHADRLQPAISQRYVAYIDSSNGSTNVTLYDLQTGQKNQIRTGISYKQSPALTDQRLVWAELREGAGSGVTATSGYFDEVWGYVTKGSGIYDIWMYNIGDGSTTRIVESGSNKAQPYLYGNLMAYVDTGKGNPDIKLLDFSNNTTTNITTADSYDAQPTMGYGYLSWIALRGNLGDLNIQPVNGGGTTVQSTPGEAPITVRINGKEYGMDPAPYIKDGRTMVPMRRVFDILGAALSWDDSAKCATAVKGNDTVKLYIGSKTAYHNNAAVVLDVPAEITGQGRTMIPLRFVAEALKCTVEWQASTRTIVINQ